MWLSTIILTLSLVIFISTPGYAAEFANDKIDMVYELNALLQAFELADSEATVRCHTTDEVPGSNAWHKLTKAKLTDIINTVGIVYGSGQFPPQTTYLYAPHRGGKVYKSTGSEGEHAEYHMIHDPDFTLETADEFWLSNSPCPQQCALLFIETFHNLPKPKIYIAHFYQGKPGEAARERARSCLALMIQDGFRLRLWDWAKFNNKITEKQCKALIDGAEGNDKFEAGKESTSENLVAAYEYAGKYTTDELTEKCFEEAA